jgi:hypothetical protein
MLGSARQRSLILPAVLACVLVAGCTGGGSSADPPPTGESATIDFLAPARDHLAPGVDLGDQTDQWLSGVARAGRTVVAVGADESANVVRPLFVVSDDDGGSWRRAELDLEPLGSGGTREQATSVAAGPDGFVASGYGADARPVTWTSPDGHTWSRTDTDTRAFRTTDFAGRVVHEGDRFYLVGGSTQPFRRSAGRVVLWRSDSGSTWERLDLAKRGLGDLVGDPSAADLVVTDGQIVVAGGIEDDARTEQPERIAIWRSDDDGRSFTADPLPADFAGDYRAYPRDLAVHRGRLHIAASGDGTSEKLGRTSWDGVVMADRGRSWTKKMSRAFGSTLEEHPSVLLRIGAEWLLAGRTDGSEEDAMLARGPDLDRLRSVDPSSLGGSGSQRIIDGVSLGQTGVLVGESTESGSREARVWRVRAGGVDAVDLPPEVDGGPATVDVTAVYASGGVFTALGHASESPVVWTSADFDRWSSVGLAGRSATVESSYVLDAARTRGGAGLAVGIVQRAHGSDGVAWVQRGRRWQLLAPSSLAPGGASGYGSVVPQAIAVGDRGVLVASTAYVNGQTEAHPVLGSPDGRSWELGRGGRRVPLSESDVYNGRTPYLDFRAPPNGEISMNAAAALRSTYLIGGGRGAAGEGSRPVIWRSRDGLRWDAASTLPSPAGVYGVTVAHLEAVGDRVVAVGQIRATAKETDLGWVSWTSTDRGRTWALGPVVAERQARVLDLLAVPGGVVAMGDTGPSDDLDAAAWFSADGAAWQRLDLGAAGRTGPGQQYVAGGVVAGDRLRLVLADVPPEGGGYLAASVALPTPPG